LRRIYEKLGMTEARKCYPSDVGEETGIHWSERRRICRVCSEEIATVEIEQDYLYELFRLRDAMREVNKKAEALIKWQQR